MNENKNVLSPERQIMIIGPHLEPLSERMGRDRFDGEVVATEQQMLLFGGTRRELTEKELLADYFNFLGDVKEASTADSSTQGEAMHRTAERFARETTYLSVTDARAAIRGLAASQSDYLLADPGRELFLYVPPRSEAKSQGKFAEDMEAYITAAFPEVTDRVCIIGAEEPSNPTLLDAKDPAKTKIVLLDDWSVTGAQLSNEVGHVVKHLEVNGANNLRSSLEVDLLVIRSDQIQDGLRDLRDVESQCGLQKQIPVRAFYSSKAAQQHAGPMPTGAHSAVDYGFGQQIAEMRDYLATQSGDHDRPLPYLATVHLDRS